MDIEYTPDPMARPRIYKAGPHYWKVLVPLGRDSVIGSLRLETHSTHKSRKGAERELEKLMNALADPGHH